MKIPNPQNQAFRGNSQPKYQAYGSDILGTHDDDEDEWLPGAVKCKEKKHSKIEGNMKIVRVVKIFTMKDGSTEIIENTFKELI